MRISGEAWNRELLKRLPPAIADEVRRGWSFNPKQPFSKSKYNAKRKAKKK